MPGENHANTLDMPQVAGVTHRFIEVGSVQVHIAEAGSGRPIVLLHSFPQHWYEWRFVLPLLQDSYHLICIDMPGFGWSSPSKRGYSTDARVKDVVDILDALKLPVVELIGHGWGAIVGFQLCLTAPSRISHFLSIGAAQPWLSRRAAMRNAWRQWHTVFWEYPYIGRRVLFKFPALTRFMMRHWAVDKSKIEESASHYALSVARPESAYAVERLNWQYVLHDIPTIVAGSARKRHLTVPTILLAGQQDVLIPPEMGAGGTPYADNIQLRVIDRTGQLLPEERPDAVANAVREFFSKGQEQ